MFRRAGLLTMVGTATVLLAGCGGSDTTAGESTPSAGTLQSAAVVTTSPVAELKVLAPGETAENVPFQNGALPVTLTPTSLTTTESESVSGAITTYQVIDVEVTNPGPAPLQQFSPGATLTTPDGRTHENVLAGDVTSGISGVVLPGKSQIMQLAFKSDVTRETLTDVQLSIGRAVWAGDFTTLPTA